MDYIEQHVIFPFLSGFVIKVKTFCNYFHSL